MLKLQVVILKLLLSEILLMLIQLAFEESHEVLKAATIKRVAWTVTLGDGLHVITCLLLAHLELLNFSLESLDHLLTELRPFGQLFLYLFVDLDVTFKSLYLLLHLCVFVDELFTLLGLMLEFSGQLLILQDGQLRSRLQLLVVLGQQLGFSLLQLDQLFLAKPVNLVEALAVLIVTHVDAFQLLSFEQLLVFSYLVLKVSQPREALIELFFFLFEVVDLLFKVLLFTSLQLPLVIELLGKIVFFFQHGFP